MCCALKKLSLMLARLFGKAGYGDYSFALVSLNFLVIGAVAGGDMVATRFITTYKTDPPLLFECLRWLNRRSLFCSLFLLIVSVITIQGIRQWDDRTLWLTTQVICLAIPFQVFSLVRQGVLRGRERPVLSVLPEGLLRPFLTLGLIGLLVGGGLFSLPDFAPVHAAAVFVVVTLATLVTGQWLQGRELSGVQKQSPANNLEAVAEWRSMGWATLLITIAMTIHGQSDIWMLGIFVESDQVGPYAAAAKYSAFVVFGINAVNTALGPMIARTRNDREQLQKLATKAAGLSFFFGLMVSMVFLLFPSPMLNFYGTGFEEASLPLRILVAGNLFNVFCGSVGALLSMSGNHQTFMKILLVSMLLNIGLNLVLVPLFQTTGAAIATTISVIFWNGIALVVVRRKLGIRPGLGGWV